MKLLDKYKEYKEKKFIEEKEKIINRTESLKETRLKEEELAKLRTAERKERERIDKAKGKAPSMFGSKVGKALKELDKKMIELGSDDGSIFDKPKKKKKERGMFDF